MNGIPPFDLSKYIQIDTGHLTDEATNNLTQLYSRLQNFDQSLPKNDDATEDDITPDKNYIGNTAGVSMWKLPTICEFGSDFLVTNIGAGGWKITIGSGQSIIYAGASGSTKLEGSGIGTCATLKCVEKNNIFLVTSHEGSLILS